MLTAQLGCLQERWESPGAEYLQSADANGALPGIKEPAKAAAEAIAVSAEPSAALSEDTDLGVRTGCALQQCLGGQLSYSWSLLLLSQGSSLVG